ncbi:aminotransferase class III-fold pyridoxal phosphate-dependent enzyme [Pseudotabrizicola sp. 4114]|uniref:aminotransferase class III-fold pyridoxal phosphate-dependent enzyme n=1 Tax=Pseudotabrizicola sp. 4114 TaxID=2817731 RepID=UPI00285A321D|nr:4-aminobutyrate aminotransferase-like enzyme/Ser/Thr protein kinase RdoA (MazF antagonist) [Pseudorhodobacter sp. 4114]
MALQTQIPAETRLEDSQAPDLSQSIVAACVAQAYGLTGEWKRLGGEREQNFRLVTADGAAFVVKIAARAETLDGLMFQMRALDHIARVDPDLPVPRVRRTVDGAPTTTIRDETGAEHVLRLLTFLPGTVLFDQLGASARPLSAEDLLTLGAGCGRIARALRGYAGQGAPDAMPWDLQTGVLFSAEIEGALPADVVPLYQTLRPQLETMIETVLPGLRAQVIYNDFHESNVLVTRDKDLRVEGVIDFGDMIHGPLVQDIAVAVASLMHWATDPVFAAQCLVRGYQRHMALEAEDLAVLRQVVLARLLLQVGMVAYRNTVDGWSDPHLDGLQARYIKAIKALHAIDDASFSAGMMPSVVPGAPANTVSAAMATPGLLSRREGVLGKTYTFYNEPLEVVRGHGCYLYDAAGKEYLDCYNNVANLGHCHPYVVDALARQAGTLNTNSRYLHHEIVRLGERLSGTLPPELDTWVFVCTGSEANDLAVRLARAVSGKDGIVVTENSYHGNTSVMAPLSLIDYDRARRPDWVETVPPPNLYRGPYREGANDAGQRYAAHVTGAAEVLAMRGPGMAGLMIDSIFDANGALVPPPDYMPRAYAAARKAGALVIADEVQMGFARSGSHMWGFQAFDVVPDIVTMGKPMGNGHPIAALVTRRDIAARVQAQTGYFNTFGGNTVSAAVGNACLDVLQGEDLQGNAARSGARLLADLRQLADRHPLIGHIQGRGLFLGVELVTDRDSRAPAKLAARWVRERMKDLGVLVSSTGPFGNIIKIRPPLVFSLADAARCVDALDRALTDLPAEMRQTGQ